MFFIAEAGSNHDGDFERAKKLIDIADYAGADAVKFQLIPPFKKDWLDQLIGYCVMRDIEFMATPFSNNGIHSLIGRVKHWKISSTEAADKSFMDKVIKAADGDTIFVSDGAVNQVKAKNNIIPLACVVKYPAEPEDYCLNYKGVWGLSDHTESKLLPIIATAKGACVIEKHFTDDKTREGPDHGYALSPRELRETIEVVRRVEDILCNKKTTIREYVGRKLKW